MKKGNLHSLARQLSYHPRQRMEIFRGLDLGERAGVLLHLTRHLQFEVLKRLQKDELIAILEHLDPDDATDLLQLLPEKGREPVMAALSRRARTDISLLLKFDPQTAAGLMSLDYVLVDVRDDLMAAAKKVRVHERRTGKMPAILAMDGLKLAGYLPGHELGYGRPRAKVGRHIRKLGTVQHSAEAEEVLDIFKSHPHNKIAVLGSAGQVIGLIYSDDILRLLREREASSLYDFAGVHDEESVYDPIGRKTKFRYKWLMANLATAFLAAFIVGLFQDTITKYVLLAVYMPIVAGMGGNAATQTLAVLVRGISLKQIELKTAWQTLRSELGASFINGLINGLIVAGVVAVKDGNPLIGLILAFAMIFNLLIAAFFGTLVPLFMKKLGKDPASSATIFITTATDVFGFLVFLGLARLLLD